MRLINGAHMALLERRCVCSARQSRDALHGGLSLLGIAAPVEPVPNSDAVWDEGRGGAFPNCSWIDRPRQTTEAEYKTFPVFHCLPNHPVDRGPLDNCSGRLRQS